jgi:dihydroorotate dehydrogenase (fumarate)
MAVIATTYMGIPIPSPIVCSSSPLCHDLGNLHRMEQAGAGAVVLHSLFEEQIVREAVGLHSAMVEGEESYAEATSYFPSFPDNRRSVDDYVSLVIGAKRFLSIPVIASLNGSTRGGWIDTALALQEAGADAIELNIYHLPTDPEESAADVEARYLDLVLALRSRIHKPLAVKLGAQFTAPLHFARSLEAAGANAIVIFNRFYQPDIDVEEMTVVPNLKLSDSSELRLRLRWTALMAGKVGCSIGVTGGVHTATDVVKCLAAGADVAMMTSALLRNGVSHLLMVQSELRRWLEEHEYESVDQLRGCMSHASSPNPEEYERSNYIQVLGSYAAPARR